MAPAQTAPAPAEPQRSNALAIITTADQFSQALTTFEKTCNLLTPFATIGGLAPQHAIFTTLVKINTDKAAGEVYDGVDDRGRHVLQYMKAGELALAKNGLRKVASALGINIHLEYLHDGGAIRHFYHVKAVAAWRDIDGSWVMREASEAWDLRDGSERMRGWTVNQIAEGRKHGLRQCESRAINAVIRECGCGVKQTYTKAELDRPFVAMRVNFVPDPTNADQMRHVQESAMQSASLLFAGRPPAGLPASTTPSEQFTDDQSIDMVPVGRSATAAATAPKAEPKAEPKPDLPPCEGAVKILKVETVGWTKNGKSGERYVIHDSNGGKVSTFDKQHRDDAKRFCAESGSGEWVEVVTETNGPYTNIVKIIKAGSEPPLPGMDEV